MDYLFVYMIWMGICLVLIFVGLFVGLKADKDWRNQAQYYPVSPLKFIVMSLVTLDFYFFFWFMKNWRFIADRDNTPMSPFLRSFFSVFFFYPLMNDIRKHSPENKKMPKGLMLLLTIIFVGFGVWNGFYWRIDYPIPIVIALLAQFGLLTIILPVVLKIYQINDPLGRPARKNSRFGPLAIAGIVFGGPLAIWFFAAEINYLPTDKIYSADYLWEKDREFLSEAAFFGENEELVYFFSTGFLSIKEDGNILTSEKILSYYDDGEGGTFTDYAYFDNITDARVDYADSWSEYTVLEITWDYTDSFYLFLPGEKSEDMKFINKFKELSGVNVHPAELEFY